MLSKSAQAFLVVFLCFSGLAIAQTAKPGVMWLTSTQRAVQDVKAQQRPLLLYFTGQQCAWCRKLEHTTWNHPAVSATIQSGFVALKIDGEKEERLMEQFHVRGLPTTVILSANGRELDRVVGYASPEKMQSTLMKSVPRTSNVSFRR